MLVPFALWNKTAFLSEKVLGNVIASGIKLMVLAIIVGIGSTIFSSVTSAFTPGEVTLQQAAATILASLSLLALGIFGPGIAAGLVSGAPQLGAGAAAGTALGAGAGLVAGGALGMGAARAAGGATQSAVRSGAAMAGGASTAWTLGSAGQSGMSAIAGGASATLKAGMASAGQSAKSFLQKSLGNPQAAFAGGAERAFTATGGKRSGASVTPASGQPGWASQLQRDTALRDASIISTQSVGAGDRPGWR